MKEDSVYLQHILDCIENIFSDTKNLTENDFINNRTIKDAVARNIEIIGEAVKMLSEEIKEKDQNIPWRKIARTRDMLIHHYFDVDDLGLWKIIIDDLPQLKLSIKNMLTL